MTFIIAADEQSNTKARNVFFTNYKHAELLDADYIIPDADEFGGPIVNNGLLHGAQKTQGDGSRPLKKSI
ncbi:hypothetical protein SPSYN_02113 [Sporotomaculum syntrophicum]|uniref:Uncharacterized protein n=1 Tax=Sporotomaculum syntrophicum TaxID=182264 RepID=A0A9D2WPP5_9FIRM|nr:hypothetical protein [Sporotomaculum syntrophicum]KAF1084337.1 hypothetical protein SPSYN_02113 [Sporotomaculum syntrophicum]